MPCMSSPVKFFLLRFVLIALVSPAVLAWGASGHRIVGHIAAARVCDSTREELAVVLDGVSLAEAGLWADKIRGYERWNYSKPWHYINVPDGMDPAEVEPSARGNVLSAIELQQEELDYGSNLMRARRQALQFLIHLLADVHQPLHVGRREDQGGNTIKVRSGQVRGTSNLHRYWDSDVLAGVAQEPQAYAASLLARAEPELAGWEPLELHDWARESADFRPLIYQFGAGAGQNPVQLDAAYQRQALVIVEQRLVLAGLRLAAQLDSLYCSID
jgi:hypothetical protein